MNRYVAFLRGMNLGGRRVTNDELRSHFEALGCEEVATFRASGNVIFTKDGRPAELTAQLEASKGKLQVALLTKKPTAAAAKQAMALSTDADRLAIERRELYWLPNGGVSESELDWKAIEATLGPTTVRTKGTIDQIAAKHFG